MDDETLSKRTQMIFYMLSCEDPQYPRVNFLLRLQEDVRRMLLNDTHLHNASEETLRSILTTAAEQLVRAHAEEMQWREIVAGWFAKDIYDALHVHLEQVLGHGA